MPEVAPMPDDARHRVLYRLIGQIITHWAHAEWLLFILFGIFVGCDIERSRIVLAAHQSFRAKRELIERLGRAYLPIEHVAEFDQLMSRVKHLSEKRNMLAHHRPYYLSDKRVWRFMNDGDETQPDHFGRSQDVQTGNLRAWVREIDQLNTDLLGFFAVTRRGPLRAQPRQFGELEKDRATLAFRHRIHDAEPQPPPESSLG